jgi:hypothetical protein
MDQQARGLSQQQQNDCRAALNRFIDRHQLSDWEMTVKVGETAAGKLSVKIEIVPPLQSGLTAWPVEEVAVADASFDVAAEVDKMLELGFQARVQQRAY